MESAARSAVLGDTTAALRRYQRRAAQLQSDIDGSADAVSAPLRLAQCSAQLNCLALLLRKERWRSALRECLKVQQALDQVTEIISAGSSSREGSSSAADAPSAPSASSATSSLELTLYSSQAAELRLRLALAHGTALSHLRGKGKGAKAAADAWRLGLREAELAEVHGQTFASVDLIMQIADKLQQLGEPLADDSVTGKQVTADTRANAATAEKAAAAECSSSDSASTHSAPETATQMSGNPNGVAAAPVLNTLASSDAVAPRTAKNTSADTTISEATLSDPATDPAIAQQQNTTPICVPSTVASSAEPTGLASPSSKKKRRRRKRKRKRTRPNLTFLPQTMRPQHPGLNLGSSAQRRQAQTTSRSRLYVCQHRQASGRECGLRCASQRAANLLGALLGRGRRALMASEASSSAVNSSGPGASTAEKMAP